MGALESALLLGLGPRGALGAPDSASLARRRSWGAWARGRFPRLGPWLDRALNQAIDAEDEARGKALLAWGADPDRETLPGLSLAFRCARFGRVELLAWSAACGARLGRAEPHGWSAAHHAAAKGQSEAIAALAALGAPMGAKSDEGYTPLLVACRESKPQACAALCALPDSLTWIDEPDARGETPLGLCSRKGFAECAEALLRAGADLERRDRRGFQPLHHAASNGMAALCEMLIERGAHPEAPGPWGKTPSQLAAGKEGCREALMVIERAALRRASAELMANLDASTPQPAPARGPRRL